MAIIVQSPENARNAARADRGLTAYHPAAAAYQEGRGDIMADLLCDLMHLADREGIDFRGAVELADEHHAREVEQARDKARAN